MSDIKERTEDAMQTIMDCFTGADGGVSFIKTQSLSREMVSRAENDDKSAEEICNIIIRMSNFVKYAEKL